MWQRQPNSQNKIGTIKRVTTEHQSITKTSLYNFNPRKPQFYIVKLGFTGVYIIFLISAHKQRLWVLVEAVLTSTHNLCFEQKYERYQNFFTWKFSFLVIKFSVYLNRRVFVMEAQATLYHASSSVQQPQFNYLNIQRTLLLPLIINYSRSSVTFASCDWWSERFFQ